MYVLRDSDGDYIELLDSSTDGSGMVYTSILARALRWNSSNALLNELTKYHYKKSTWSSGLEIVRVREVSEPRYEEVETL